MPPSTCINQTSKEGRMERDLALKRVEAHTDKNWAAQALFAIIRLAQTREKFTGADVWESGLDKPDEPRRLGPILLKAAELGFIRPTKQYRESSMKMQHARPLRVWRSLVRK